MSQLDLFGGLTTTGEADIVIQAAGPGNAAADPSRAVDAVTEQAERVADSVGTAAPSSPPESPFVAFAGYEEVDLDNYQGEAWPRGAYATLGPPPRVAVMRAVEAVAGVLGWSSSWSKLLQMWWLSLNRLSPQWEEQEEEYRRVAAMIPPDAMATVQAGFHSLVVHFHVNAAYCDILGPVHMEVSSRSRRAGTGQFFTPWDLCLVMAQMAGVPETPFKDDGEPWSVCDPAIGSGSTLLAFRGLFAKRFGRMAASTLLLAGQDIDADCVLMSRIQLRLTDAWAMKHLLATASLAPAVARDVVRLAALIEGL